MTGRADLAAVSLFSNCGAGDVGYRNAGFRFVALAELDQRRLEVALLNHPEAVGIPGDLTETWTEVIEEAKLKLCKGSLALLAACPPCQGMSSAHSNRGKEDDPDSSDARNLLVLPIAHVADALQPRVVVVENVPAFLRRMVRHPETSESVTAADLLIERLAPDYDVYPFLTDLADYGIPQTRRRAFLTFVRRGDPANALLGSNATPYPAPTHALDHGVQGPISIGAALQAADLPSLDASTARTAMHEAIPLHAVPVWDDRRYEMVAAIPPNSGGSAWTNDLCPACGGLESEEEAARCSSCGSLLLRPVTLDDSGEYRLVKGFRSSSYRRMNPDLPAATITTASGHIGSDRTVHPSENRLLSTLECALLQGFPKDFVWGEALQRWGHSNIRAMIGEAVPPRFTELHGRALSQLLHGGPLGGLLSSSDPRCRNALAKLSVPAAS